MLRFINLLVYIIFGTLVSNAQSISFSSEMVIGNRSTTYQHFIEYSFNDKWSINNVSLFDTEHVNDKNNIFFIRNMLSHRLNKHFKANAAFGIKNPGAFATLNSQYQYNTTNFKLSYIVGSTYQNGFTLEQALSMNFTPNLTQKTKAYINLFAVVNTDLKQLDRGIQQLRVGIKKQQLIMGGAFNFDQFTKAEKTLENFGIFAKYNF
jgi:hypothetical protein